jgi:hypothetical protein
MLGDARIRLEHIPEFFHGQFGDRLNPPVAKKGHYNYQDQDGTKAQTEELPDIQILNSHVDSFLQKTDFPWFLSDRLLKP